MKLIEPWSRKSFAVVFSSGYVSVILVAVDETVIGPSFFKWPFYKVDGRHEVAGFDADFAGYDLPLLHNLADCLVDVGYYGIGWTGGTVILYLQALARRMVPLFTLASIPVEREL